jgi:hypothetical protein
MAGDSVFPAMDIRDAIGELADGHPIDPELVPFVRAAVAGPCLTSDEGTRQFVVNLLACDQFNVDTEELIWPAHPDAHAADDIPLRVLTDRKLWQQMHDRWAGDYPREWTAFVWRIAHPLSLRLPFAPAWRPRLLE